MLGTIIIILIVVILLYYLLRENSENYGGPIKVIRDIPRNTCYHICQSNFHNCAKGVKNIGLGETDCQQRYKDCLHTCVYKNLFSL